MFPIHYFGNIEGLMRSKSRTAEGAKKGYGVLFNKKIKKRKILNEIYGIRGPKVIDKKKIVARGPREVKSKVPIY